MADGLEGERMGGDEWGWRTRRTDVGGFEREEEGGRRAKDEGWSEMRG